MAGAAPVSTLGSTRARVGGRRRDSSRASTSTNPSSPPTGKKRLPKGAERTVVSMSSSLLGKGGLALATVVAIGASAAPTFGDVTPDAVRQAAFDAGLDSLATVPVPPRPELNDFIITTNAGKQAMLVLGK